MGDPQQPVGDEVKMVFDPNTGISKNYYGGQGVPDGDWHGHADVNEQGQFTHPNGPRPAGEKR
jgi:hypothetical protein